VSLFLIIVACIFESVTLDHLKINTNGPTRENNLVVNTYGVSHVKL